MLYLCLSNDMTMAKYSVCGMFVEEKPDSIIYNKDGREYYFWSKQRLSEFMQPERELRKSGCMSP